MAKLAFFVFTVWCALAVFAYETTYEGYELVQAIPRNDHDLKVIDYLRELDPELDFWLERPDEFHVFVSPEKLTFVKDFLTSNGVSVQTINDHIQQDIDEEETRLMMKKAFNYNDYNTFDDISAELVSLAGRCRADLGISCEVYSAGKSAQDRDLWVLKMSKSGSGRRGVWVDATTHAREWLGTATHLKIVSHLIDDYPTDADVQRLVDTYDWYFLPVANPDGYVYSWTNDRLWRKNRAPNVGSACIGTDLNRNYDQAWGNAGSSTSPCSDTFRGSSAGSEPETQVVQSEARRLGPSLATSIHFHTYGQYWLIPWGSYAADGRTCNYAADDAEMMVVANAVANAIQSTFGTNWLRGNSCATIYPASGLTMDYFKAIGGVKYVATPELRGNSFVASNTQIQPSYEEVWNGFIALFNTLP